MQMFIEIWRLSFVMEDNVMFMPKSSGKYINLICKCFNELLMILSREGMLVPHTSEKKRTELAMISSAF